MNGNTWEKVLDELLTETDFKQKIQKRGYYLSDSSFKKFTKGYNFTSIRNTAGYLSLDFESQQSKVLRNNEMYLLRTGSGNFIILHEKRFPKPYLDLKISDSVKLNLKTSDFEDLLDAFNIRNENAGLEQLNVLGVYDLLIKRLFGNVEWKIGPRGSKRSRFDVYAKNHEGKIELIYKFDGQEELDYSLWTKNYILLFEAKSLQRRYGLDIGWHKLAYTASRFRKYSKYKIKPVYFLKWYKVIHLFVFPDFKFYNDGFVINDDKARNPEKVFRIDLEKTLMDF